MPRFRKDPDPRFWRLNRSIEFDWRLAPYDIDQPTLGSASSACSTTRSWSLIDSGLERVRGQMGEHGFQRRRATRTSTWRSSACSARRSARWLASCTPGALGIDQVATDVAMVVQAHSLRAIELPG